MFEGTQIGADGQRHPAGSQPVDPGPFRRYNGVFGSPGSGAVPVWDPVDARPEWSEAAGGGLSVDAVNGLIADALAASTSSLAFDEARRTAGDLTLNSTAFVDLPVGSDLDVTVPAAVGDRVCVGLSAFWNANNLYAFMDAVTMVSGSAVRYLSTGTGTPATFGVASWRSGFATPMPVGPPAFMLLQADDIEGGNVTFRFRYRTLSSANKVLAASTSDPLLTWVMNLTRSTTPTFP